MTRRAPISLLAAALLLTGCPTSTPRRSGGPVFAGEGGAEAVCVVEIMPNYIVHLTALAGLPHHSTYAEEFGGTVDVEAAQILRRHAPLLQWGYGTTGDLAPFFVLLPTYLPLADQFELSAYLRTVDGAMRTGDYGEVRGRYHGAHERLRRWLFDYESFFYSRAGIYRENLRAVRQLVQVYEYSFERYEEQVWSQVELDLDLLADELNGEMWSLELIDTWERLTGVRFADNRYEVLLTAAPAGTGVTGLGYARSLVAAQADHRQMLGLIVHEVGAHLLIELFREASDRDAASGELDWATYAAYEGLAQHYTRQILPGFETEIENDVEIFVGIYRQLQDQEPKAGARRLMQRALKEYRDGLW